MTRRFVVVETVTVKTVRLVEAANTKDAQHVVNIAQERYMVGGDAQDRARAAILRTDKQRTTRDLDVYDVELL